MSATSDVDPDAVTAAATSVPSVASMSKGSFGEVATYLPGRNVPGVRISDREVEVHVVARWGWRLPEVGDQVREAVKKVAAGTAVTVYIDDIDLPDIDTTVALPPGT